MTNKYNSRTNDQLDCEVAERVMGWKHYKSEQGGNGAYWKDKERVFQAYDWQFCPSTSFDACLEHVIPAMRERGIIWSACEHDRDKKTFLVNYYGIDDSTYIHKSLPRATCISALLALDAMKGDEDKQTLLKSNKRLKSQKYKLQCKIKELENDSP